nr:T9SS type A sorting domain-containing protein [Candidatus Cloacimonadota bacterium]
IDNVLYDDDYPWSPEPDGTGSTLELRNPNLNNNVAGNWAASAPYGTPGIQNQNMGNDEIPEVPQELTLYQNFPNPFNPATTISYYLPEAGKTELRIYNVKGQLVKKYVEFQEKGAHSYFWDSKDDSPKSVASGIYFYQLISPDNRLSRKMLLLK